MGRTEPSVGRPPAGFRKDARAKKAKSTVNQLIPSLLRTHPRSRRGIEAAEFITNLPAKKAQGDGPATSDLSSEGPRLTLRVADTLVAAHSLLCNATTGKVDLANTDAKVAILNMASPLSPGGGFTNGASSQEESLCMRTTLLPSLKDEYYRLAELSAVYTPDVLVFRDERNEDLEKRDRWFVDCISAAMLRGPETEVDDSGRGRYVNEADRELVVQKARMVMRICQAKGIKKIVLGAWGCGAYGNPVAEVATAWRKVLLAGKGGKEKKKGKKETWEGIEEIVFAIKNPGMAEAFGKAFGEELMLEEMAESKEEEDEQDELEEARMRELQEKIQELELRIEQVKSPQLRSGLNSILTGLRSQRQDLEPSEQGISSHEDEDDSG